MSNVIYVNDGTPGVLKSGEISAVGQGAVGVVLPFTVKDFSGAAVDITGYTIAATMKLIRTGAVTAVDGTLAVTGGENGAGTWTVSANDTGTDGAFNNVYTFTKDGSPTFVSSPTAFTVTENASITDSATNLMVGILQAIKDWLTAVYTSAAGATIGQVLTADGEGGAAFEDAAGGGAVDSVFGRTGEVVAATSDYDADQVDFAPAGTIEATDVQAAIEEVNTDATGLFNGVASGLSSHISATTSVHGITNTAKLNVIAGLTWAANSIILLTGTATAAVQTLASHVVTLLQSADATAARAAIGAGTGDGDVSAVAVIADNAIVRGDGGAKGVQAGTPLITEAGVVQLLASGAVHGELSGHASNGLVLTGRTPGVAFRRVTVSGSEISFQYSDITAGLMKRFTGVNATPQTVIPNGGGDVTLVLSGTFTISDGAGNVDGGVITATAPSGSFNLYDDGGTNTCQLQVAADGSVVVVRTAGSRTYACNLNLNWL